MLIGLHGRKQAGKDTVFARACHLLSDVVSVERVSFADRLYESAAASLGVSVDFLQTWKSSPLACIQVTVPSGVGEAGPYNERHAQLTIREYLQRYGTEAHRSVFGDDFWVDNVDLEHRGRVVMVTDVRFENEARAVRRAGGRVVNVIGPEHVESAGDDHASETPLPGGLVDFNFHNDVRDDDFRRLDSQVSNLLRQLLRLESGVREPVYRP